MSAPRILFERTEDGVGVVTLNRPEVRNAIDLETVRAFHALLDERLEREDVACLVVTGAGEKAFAAGADIAQLLERGRDEALRAINATLFKRIEEFPWPTIAAVRGYALGGGCELAMACDLRVCGEGATFGQPEVGLGIVAGAGALERLPRLVGLGRAKELLYTGRFVGADEALRIGLVNRVVPDGEVLDAALGLAREILRNDPLAVRLTKASVNATARPNDQVGTTLDAIAQAVCFESEEKRRRMRAFLEKRKRPRGDG